MMKECEFYAGMSERFRVAANEKKEVNLVLHRVCICTPTHILFEGRVMDSRSGKYVKNVQVTVKFGKTQKFDCTDECGRFCIRLPRHVDIVSLRLSKRGFAEKHIEAFHVRDNCINDFYIDSIC